MYVINLFYCSKQDIPVSNYRTHTLHCARNVTKCPDCDSMVTKDSMAAHYEEAHTLRECDQCHISVEAFKLPEHKVMIVILYVADRENIFTTVRGQD